MLARGSHGLPWSALRNVVCAASQWHDACGVLGSTAPALRFIGRSPLPTVNGGDTLEPIAAEFDRRPKEVADALAKRLTQTQRIFLISALAQYHERRLDDKYFGELFDAADNDANKELNRKEFQQALLAHQALQSTPEKAEAPSWRALQAVFLASAIPFVGFGFLDNFLMLICGEEIDNLFGARLGFSTLASAGLGNAVADMVGVGAANGIETAVRKLSLVRDPQLSKTQRNLPVTKSAKMVGAVMGVMLGCLLGLTPLFWNGTFFVQR